MHSSYFDNEDAFISYHDLPGNEPVFVYLHGFTLASSASFPRVAHHPLLAPNRSLLIDLLGYGYSSHPPAFPHTLEAHASSIADLLDRLGAPPYHVIGHSMGGAIAIALAAQRPDLVSSLTVIEPNLDPADAFFSGVMIERWPTEADYLTVGHKTLIAETVDEATAEPHRLDLGSYVGTLRAADPRAVYRCARALVNCDVREAFFSLNMPRTYVFGERSLPHRHAPWLQTAGVPTAIVPDAGHDVPNDNPDGLAAVIASIVQE